MKTNTCFVVGFVLLCAAVVAGLLGASYSVLAFAALTVVVGMLLAFVGARRVGTGLLAVAFLLTLASALV